MEKCMEAARGFRVRRSCVGLVGRNRKNPTEKKGKLKWQPGLCVGYVGIQGTEIQLQLHGSLFTYCTTGFRVQGLECRTLF